MAYNAVPCTTRDFSLHRQSYASSGTHPVLFPVGAYPGRKNDQDLGAAAHLPLSVAEFQNALSVLTAIRLHDFALNYSLEQFCC